MIFLQILYFLNKTKFLLLIIITFATINTLSATKQKVYPLDLRWNNVKTNFGCKGDGVTDDTESLRRAARTYSDIYHTNITVFLPKGKYLISDSIKLLNDYWDANVTFIGEDPDSTFIILKNNAAGFQDVNNPRPMIETRSGNQAFGMYFKNLIINTGRGNPGAVGIDYITSNYGTIENVKFISPDENSYCGLLMERAWAGPGLIKNISITGFKYGIKINSCEYSMTFEDITLINQTISGIWAACNTLAINNLKSTNKVRVIESNSGRITLVNAVLNGGSSTNHAIIFNDYLFARNVTTLGYAGALLKNGVAIGGSNVSEYYSGPNYSLFPNRGLSLRLPIEETPVYVNNDLTKWGKANDYGCLPTNPQYGFYDAGPGLQAAFNSGNKVIYFDKMGDNGSGYCIYNDIVIPASVEMIIGFNWASLFFFNNSKLIINTTGGTLIIDGIAGTRIFNNSIRTVVFKSSSLGEYTNSAKNTNGKIFLEDIGVSFKPKFPVNLWARQFNPEIQDENDTMLVNNGGNFWVLGFKTEGRATVASTSNGGSTELLGGLIYPASTFSRNNNIAFTVDNANFSSTVFTRTSYVNNGWYANTVVETQGTEIKTLVTPSDQSFYNFDFYRSYEAPKYKLQVNNGKGSGDYESNTKITIIADAPLKGYKFSKWSGDNFYITNIFSDTSIVTMPNININVRAEYELIKYNLLVNSGKGSGEYESSTKITVIADAPIIGYKFSKWSGDTEFILDIFSDTTIVIMPDKNLGVTAEYELIKYILLVNNGQGSGNYEPSTKNTIIVDTPQKGYKFSKWSGDTEFIQDIFSDTTIVIMPGKNVSVNAEYELIKYSLQVNNGQGAGNYEPITKNNIIADIAPKGYKFSKWSGDTEFIQDIFSDTTIVIMPEKNISVKAEYILITSVEEITNTKIILYPNPVTDFINITGIDGKMTIYNILGAIVWEDNVISGQIINLSNLQNGVYLLIINNYKQQLIKQ